MSCFFNEESYALHAHSKSNTKEVDMSPTPLAANNGSTAKIRYTLQPVPPKARASQDEDGPYAAHVVIRPASLMSIAEQMVREGSKYSEAEIIAITTQLMDTIAYRLSNGESVNLGSMLRLKPSIRGTFETAKSAFDPTQHEVVVTATIGSRLRHILASTAVEQMTSQQVPKFLNVSVMEQSNGTSTFTFILKGRNLLAQAGTWVAVVNGKEKVLKPIAIDNRRAVFCIKHATLAVGTTFTLMCHYKQGKKSYALAYKTALTVQ
jgi:hypothetical protein